MKGFFVQIPLVPEYWSVKKRTRTPTHLTLLKLFHGANLTESLVLNYFDENYN